MSTTNDPPPRATALSRRALVRSGSLLAGAAIGAPVIRALAQSVTPAADTTMPVVPPDATKVPGQPSEALAGRSAFERPVLTPTGVTSGSSLTPHQALRGSITPSDLHFQRHHNGIPVIDPTQYSLTVHGLVDKPLTFTLDELKRFPSVTRVYCIECSGNGGGAYRSPKPDMTPQMVDGLTSNSEWTGVPVKTLLEAVGVQRSGSWVLAEGGDAAVLLRSVPMEKMLDDALIVYAQNGEAVRPANGYPARLLLPGYEGNMCVKWLRRLEVVDQPAMSREETAKYTDPLPDGTSRQFSFVLDAKSIITSPAFPEKLPAAGWWPVRGIAWSGRGKITGVDVSTDGGTSWHAATLVGDIHSHAHTRFEYMWQWDGKATSIMSRATDETGYVQPTLEVYRKARGPATYYHHNAIRTWQVASDGAVTFGG
jgi:sulfane dehydrogenase subunit SoxC